MDWTTFKTETLEYLWRVGDTALDARMPKIVRTAEARLRTDLKLTDEDVTVLVEVTANPFTLPSAADRVTTLAWEDVGIGYYTTPRDFQRATESAPLYPGAISATGAVNPLEYTVEGNRVYHRRNASVSAPIEARIVYTPTPASLTDDDDTVFNAYTDLYEFAVYAEACRSLLDDEGEAKFEGLYKERLDAAQTDQNYRKFAGSPLKMQMPRRDVS